VLRPGLILSCLVVPLQLAAATAERAALVAERERLEGRFAAEQAACSQRFAATACVDDVRQRRRQALAATRAQLLDLDDAERSARAAARARSVQDKQRRAAERPAPAAPAPPAPPPSVRAPAPLPADEDRSTQREAARRDAASEASRRAGAGAQRRQEIEARQARIAQRQAARGSKAADPLPVPQVSAAASAPSRR